MLNGNFPYKFPKNARLGQNQKTFTLGEICDITALIMTKRLSNLEQLNNRQKPRPSALVEGDQKGEEVQKFVQIIEKVEKKFEEKVSEIKDFIKLRVRKLNGHFISQEFEKSTPIKKVLDWAVETTGNENLRMFRRTPEKQYLSALNKQLGEIIIDKTKNIIFLEEIPA